MDAVGLLVGVLVGGGIATAAFLSLSKGHKSVLEATQGDLNSALEKLRTEELERARLSERVKLVDTLLGEKGNLEESLQQKAEELNALRLDKQALESQIDSERNLLAERERNLRSTVDEKLTLLADAEKQLKEAFGSLAAEALSKNQKDFIALAQESLKAQNTEVKGDLDKRQEAINNLVKPLDEQLKTYQQNLRVMQEEQTKQTTKLQEQIELMAKTQQQQNSTTHELKGLLRGPTSRGRIGELFLKTMLDAAGLMEGVQYRLQVSETTEEGRSRPDCVVFLPGGRGLVIDAKTPLNAYQDALATDDETQRGLKMKEHARNVRMEVDRLARRAYSDMEVATEMVVMYLPIEASLSAALQVDPEIHTYGWNKKIIVTSPTLLYALLQMIALDWRQEALRKNAEEIEKLGKEMVDRIRIVADHFRSVGKGLDSATRAYNQAVGSMERNLLTTATKFQKLGAGSDTKVEALPTIDKAVEDFKKSEALTPLPAAKIKALESSLTLEFEDFSEEA